jgi:hypothetical protein
MDLEDLLAPVAGVFDIEEALEEWRWLFPDEVKPLVVTAAGDLFMIAANGVVLFLDTIAGAVVPAADSVEAWEQKLASDPEAVDQWLMPGFIEALREAAPLPHGHCYSPLIPPIMGGKYEVANWPPTSWQVHFSNSGRTMFALKDVPDGARITGWNYTKVE